MNCRIHLANQIRQCDPSIATINASAFQQSRKDKQRPTMLREKRGFDLILGHLLRSVVPVSAVVFDRDPLIWERQVDVVFVNRIDRDRIQAGESERRHDLRFVCAQYRAVLFRASAFAEIVMASFRPTDSGRRVGHKFRTLLWRKRLPERGVAVIRAEPSKRSAGNRAERLSALLARLIGVLAPMGVGAGLRTEVPGRGYATRFYPNRCTAMKTGERHWHGEYLHAKYTPNGSLAIAPVLAGEE